METKQERGVRCPHCGRVQKITRWRLINRETEPLAGLRAKKGTLFTVPCEACGADMRLSYDCMVFDPAHRAMVYLCPEDHAPDNQTLSALPPEPGYKLRLVHTAAELSEKLDIFDSGLEDTVVELVKVFYYAQFQAQKPEETVTDVVFAAAPAPCFRFTCQSGRTYELPLQNDYYKKVQAQYQERIWQRTGAGMLRVDAAWAGGVLEL